MSVCVCVCECHTHPVEVLHEPRRILPGHLSTAISCLLATHRWISVDDDVMGYRDTIVLRAHKIPTMQALKCMPFSESTRCISACEPFVLRSLHEGV